MRCPSCRQDHCTRVLNIRHRADGSVRRRHGCSACQIRWTSLEAAVTATIQAAPVAAR